MSGGGPRTATFSLFSRFGNRNPPRRLSTRGHPVLLRDDDTWKFVLSKINKAGAT